jgi:hypothetical protein
MIELMKRWKPLVWWAEGGHISKSIGPFLFKRMREEKVYINIREQTPAPTSCSAPRRSTAAARWAWSVSRRGALVRGRADECLKFPGGRHDDFVDTLAHIGLGLDKLLKAPLERRKKPARRSAPSAGSRRRRKARRGERASSTWRDVKP